MPSAYLHLPATQPETVAGRSNFQPEQLPVGLAQRSERKLTWIVIRVERLLPAIVVDHLSEVALAVEQPDTHDRYTEITRRLDLIASDVSQATGIDWQRLAQHEFHAEVGYLYESRIRMRLLKPGGRPGLNFCCTPESFQIFPKFRVGKCLRKPL